MKNKSSKNDMTINESIRFRKLEKSFLSRCSHFGYNEIRTSTIEPLYIFTAPGALSEDKLRRIYSFIDWDGWSGERVALKPDSTACVARFYKDHLFAENQRQKLCYVENHFEWADSGDDISERWQCGVENIGTDSYESDLEVIYMACDILREIGVKENYLYLSYPSINAEIIRAVSPKEPAVGSNFRLEPTPMEPAVGSSLRLEPTPKEPTLKEFEYHSANYLKNIRNNIQPSDYEKIRLRFENFVSVCERLDSLECPYRFDFSFSGDLEYYTGIQFQILSVRKRRSGSSILCSGGRYDNFIRDICELSEPVPAVGFALYAKNIIGQQMITAAPAETPDNRQNICIYISDITKHNVIKGQRLCDKLSRLGFTARITFRCVEQGDYEKYGLVIEVDHKRFTDGYQVLYSQKIGKPLLMNLFGELNGR